MYEHDEIEHGFLEITNFWKLLRIFCLLFHVIGLFVICLFNLCFQSHESVEIIVSLGLKKLQISLCPWLQTFHILKFLPHMHIIPFE